MRINLLEWIMNDSLRRTVHKGTTKIERLHKFAKHLAFGDGGLLQSNDPADQERQLFTMSSSRTPSRFKMSLTKPVHCTR